MLFKHFVSLSFIAAFMQCSAASESEDANMPSVQIPATADTKTTIIGSRNTTWNGASYYYGFRGIPYAKPPSGELRFKDPQSIELYPPVVDARYNGHDCPSVYATNASEDCLTLNVYTQQLIPHRLLPVIVFIHPGGLYVGSGLSSVIGPDYVLAKDVVLVTFNYRLGTLGFLNLGTPAIPGNAGFKDQVFALRWVQKHIKYFGGSAENVTLVGYSAGGLSASLHLVSPMSQGLFHKVIAMSGSLPPQTPLPRGAQLALAQRQAALMNCTAADSETEQGIVNCLNGHTGDEIAATLRRVVHFGKYNPVYPWLPVIERDFGQERFMTQDFYGALKEGHFQRVPLLVGYTNGELCSSATAIIKSARLESEFYSNFDELAPMIFMYDKAAGHIANMLRQHYLNDSSANHSNFERLCDLFSDAIIRFGSHRLASLAANHVNVHAYKFAYGGQFSNLTCNGGPPPARVEHMEDLEYLFKMAPNCSEKTDADDEMIELYVNFIYDFVVNGTIFSNTSERFPETFALITEQVEFTIGTNFFEDADLWRQLFPQ